MGHLGESEVNAFTIMKHMGHNAVTVSQRYVHPSPESVELAVERIAALQVKIVTAVGHTFRQTRCDDPYYQHARVAKLADARDLKSLFRQRECGFKSHPGHQL